MINLKDRTGSGFLRAARICLSAQETVRQANTLRLILIALGLLACWPIVSLMHEVVVGVVALVVRWLLNSGLILWIVERAEIDKVYASVAVQIAGNINVRGISVVGPIGDVLHWLLPSLFLPPELVPDKAWFSAVFQDGSSLLSRTIVRVISSGVLIFLGFILMFKVPTGQNRLPSFRRMTLVEASVFSIGLMFQLRGIWTVLGLPLTLSDLEAMGLPEFLTKVTGWSQVDYRTFIAGIDSRVLQLTPIVALIDVYAIAFLVAAVADYLVIAVRRGIVRVHRMQIGAAPSETERTAQSEVVSRVVVAHPFALLICLVLFVSVAGKSMAETRFDYNMASIKGEKGEGPQLAVAESKNDLIGGQERLKPSVVKVAGSNFRYEYTVNGKRQTIRGVGYNAQFRDLPSEKRIEAYAKDFQAMRKAGVNTILGWDQNSFDEVLLTTATQNGIGVVLPYHLPPDANYADATVCQRLKADILAWVEKHKRHPALRMWGIGNEVLHDMRLKDQRKAFAEFYRDVADAVHQADPDHPVIYREAEDVFVPILKKALSSDNVSRPWLVYGMNIFTYRLKNVLADWGKQGIDAPLVVSEFAPTGLQPKDRPAGYIKMWGMMRDHPSMVIGGFMYVWTTAGPEPLDRVYGLVDEQGNPTDGSLEAMSTLFLREAAVAD